MARRDKDTVIPEFTARHLEDCIMRMMRTDNKGGSIMKKTRAFILSMLLVIATVLIGTTAFAASKPSLSNKKLKIGKGQAYQLVVTNTGGKKVKWSSNKKKVASVSKSGVVKAKKPGKAVITAKVGKKKIKCKVTVVAKPVNLNTNNSSGKTGNTGNTSPGQNQAAAGSQVNTGTTASTGSGTTAANTTAPVTDTVYNFTLKFTGNIPKEMKDRGEEVNIPYTFETDAPSPWDTPYFEVSTEGKDSSGWEYLYAKMEQNSANKKTGNLNLKTSFSFDGYSTVTIKYLSKLCITNRSKDEYKTVSFKIYIYNERERIEAAWRKNLIAQWTKNNGFGKLTTLQKVIYFTNYIATNFDYVAGAGTYCKELHDKYPDDYALGGDCQESTAQIMFFAQDIGIPKSDTMGYASNPNNPMHACAKIKINGTWFYFEAGYVGNAPRDWYAYTIGEDGGHSSVISFYSTSDPYTHNLYKTYSVRGFVTDVIVGYLGDETNPIYESMEFDFPTALQKVKELNLG